MPGWVFDTQSGASVRMHPAPRPAVFISSPADAEACPPAVAAIVKPGPGSHPCVPASNPGFVARLKPELRADGEMTATTTPMTRMARDATEARRMQTPSRCGAASGRASRRGVGRSGTGAVSAGRRGSTGRMASARSPPRSGFRSVRHAPKHSPSGQPGPSSAVLGEPFGWQERCISTGRVGCVSVACACCPCCSSSAGPSCTSGPWRRPWRRRSNGPWSSPTTRSLRW